jgi:hypothetical protein
LFRSCYGNLVLLRPVFMNDPIKINSFYLLISMRSVLFYLQSFV